MKAFKKFWAIIAILVLAMASCKRQDNISLLISDDKAPAPVTNAKALSTPGGAKFSYTPPPDADLLYVQVSYKLADGKEKLVNSSFGSSVLEIEGFADTLQHEASLVAIDKSGNKSSPVTMSFKPLTSPLYTIANSFNILPDVGGVNYTWKNDFNTPIALLLFYKDDRGNPLLLDTRYTSVQNGDFSLQGLDTITREYSVVLRDKWGNESTIWNDLTNTKLKKRISPIYEELLDRTKFKDMGPAYRFNISEGIDRMWNGERNVFISLSSRIPWNAALDLGVTAKLTRIVFWQVSFPPNGTIFYYAHHNARVIEVYGSNAPNPTNQIDNSWTLLKTCEIIKPSGLPIAFGRQSMSDEDYDIAVNKGHQFKLPLDAPPCRYIMVKVIKGWETQVGTFSETQFYGQIQ